MLARLRKLNSSQWRMLFYLAVLLGIAAWRFLPRRWDPTLVITTERYHISSTATPEQTEALGRAAEMQYRAYERMFSGLKTFRPPSEKLKMLLYRDRDEMRRINPGLGWAEAFYQKPYCRAYYSEGESNPFQWMLHEAVHQLNEEVAGLNLEHWLEEGVAEYFSVSRTRDGELRPGTIDPYTYPVWWKSTIATEGDLTKDLANGSIILLRVIITNDGGPSMSEKVNLYYLHWWTLAHYVFERHPAVARELVARGGSLESFEALIGPVETIQVAWYAHVLRIKAAIDGATPHFRATGELPPLGAILR